MRIQPHREALILLRSDYTVTERLSRTLMTATSVPKNPIRREAVDEALNIYQDIPLDGKGFPLWTNSRQSLSTSGATPDLISIFHGTIWVMLHPDSTLRTGQR